MKRYEIILKNGVRIEIGEEQRKKLVDILCTERKDRPQFVKVDGTCVNTDSIACTMEVEPAEPFPTSPDEDWAKEQEARRA